MTTPPECLLEQTNSALGFPAARLVLTARRLRAFALSLAIAGALGCGNDAAGDGTTDAAASSDSSVDGRIDEDASTDAAGAADAFADAEPGPDAGPSSYPGEPTAGTVFWGAAIDGNGDPVVRHETPSGCVLALRRTYFRWEQRTGYLITVATDDVENGRLPWVSVKAPSWADMAAGLHDAEIDEMLTALDALDGPVWLTVHHEPEGGGGVNEPDDPAGPAGHLAMNQQVRERMTALGVDDIALLPVLMTWTWAPASGRDPEEWWAPGIYDLLGVDHYQDSEDTLLTARWAEIRLWAAGKGVDLAVGEWGMRGTDAAAGQRVSDWYEAAVASATDGAGAQVVGLAAFDSGLNSPNGSWELVGAQLATFQELICDPRTAHVPST